jgi:hypothetical protein
MIKSMATILVLMCAAAFAAPARADSDPTLSQVYAAAQSGHLGQAQQMMQQVLRDHPKSAKAHFVTAELYAKAGSFPLARQELSTAEALEPGLASVRPEALQSLRAELSGSRRTTFEAPAATRPAGTPWGLIIVLVAAGALVWMIVSRRRSQAAGYPASTAMTPTTGAGPGYGPTYGAGYGTPPMGPAGGSGLLGNLASGMAVGAGVVAGEELVRHVFDSGHAEARELPREEHSSGFANEDPAVNGDMGGNDFGVNDAGSWDDGGGSFGGDGGGGDW